MKGYIYSMFAGADPGQGWTLTDPIFGRIPTLGACMPNIRRAVEMGDHIFVVSGRVPGVQQYVVGGFQVKEKIDALAAYRKFPAYRMHSAPDGSLRGNIISDAEGRQIGIDYHSNFAERVRNYVVGHRAKMVQSQDAIEHAREQTLPLLRRVFEKDGSTVGEVLGRWRRLDENQIQAIRHWIDSINGR